MRCRTCIVAIGGSDAGISAALRARELDPTADVTVVVADAYPNFSICGIPYYFSGEVAHWRNLAHRTARRPRSDRHAAAPRHPRHRHRRRRPQASTVRDPDGDGSTIAYDELIVGTGAVPVRPPIDRARRPRRDDGVHLLHSMGDTFAADRHPRPDATPKTALIVGAGYVGLEMAEGLTARGIAGDPGRSAARGAPHRRPRARRPGARRTRPATASTVHTDTTVTAHQPRPPTRALHVDGHDSTASHSPATVDLVLVVVGVRPDTELAADAGATLGAGAPVVVDERCAPASRTSWPPATASSPTTACSASPTCRWAPPPTSKAGSPARTRSAGTPGSPAASAPRSSRCSTSSPPAPACAITKPAAGSRRSPRQPAPTTTRPTTPAPADQHPRHRRRHTGRLLGAQLVGHRGTEIAKRVDTYATALFHEHDRRQPSATSTSPTPRRSDHPGTPYKWPPNLGPDHQLPTASHLASREV